MIESTPSADPPWRYLLAKLRPFVARRVAEADVDDVVQDVLLRIQRGLPSLRDDARLGPWVYRTARHAIVDHHRRVARQPRLADALPSPEAYPYDADPDDRRPAEEVAMHAALFITMLPSPYREALTLTELEGYSQKEAAEMLGISLSGMKSRVQRGRRKLRDALEACCDIALDARQRVVSYTPRPDGKLPDGCCG
ncbi:MAG: sigma-70 family RNA polymerase sigma factor [Myxococcota bacterium]